MFDILTVAAIADELSERIVDGRIQQVGMLSRTSIGLEIYAERQRRHLVAFADHDNPRVLLVEKEPAFDRQLVTPLLLLLRKYVRGGIVVGVEQPPLDRIVRVSIAKRLEPHNAGSVDERVPTDDELDAEDESDGLEGATFVHLVIEIMGRHSNIMLVDDDDRVMEAAKRVTPKMSRVRPIGPKTQYTLPPPGDRGDSRRVSTAELGMLLASERPAEAIAAILPKRLRGISPQMAREIAYQALGSAMAKNEGLNEDQQAAIARETRRLLEPLITSAWSPTVYLDEDGLPAAYSAISMASLEIAYTPRGVASISQAAAMGSDSDGPENAPGRHAQRRARLVKSIQEGRTKLETKLAALETQRAASEAGEQWRSYGETIYAYLWAIKPGQTLLEVDGLSIPLEPSLSASENAQGYFERYRKAQGAGAHVPALIAGTLAEIAYLDQQALLAAQAVTFPEIEDVAVEWETYQRSREGPGGRSPRRPRSAPPRRTKALFESHGNAIYLGRSSLENDRVTFDIAGPNDTWLHARGVPGSHVIVRWGNAAGNEDDATLQVAAELAAYYSGSRESASVEVDITRRRHVRKIKGAGPGMVTYRNERTVSVNPKDSSAG